MSDISYPSLPPRSPRPPSPQSNAIYTAGSEIPPYEQLDAAPEPEAPYLHQPPPQHQAVPTPQQTPAPKQTFFMKASENKWAKRATRISDAIGVRANAVGEKFGAERFWPTTGDGYLELKKCARILSEFTSKGLPTSEKPAGKGKARQITKVYKKIPPSIIRNAKGIVIFSCFRSGFAPLAGSGGSGVVMTRLPNGQWSAPAFVAPNNISGGLMFGADAYNAILILNSDVAVNGFKSHHFTIGSEVAVAAGPLGAGAGMDTGIMAGKRAPIFTYVVSRGLYAGIELTGQIFVEREEENEIVYQRKGLRTIEILSGNVPAPPEAQPLFDALYQAEHGMAQGAQLEQEMTAEEAKEKDMPDTHEGTESRPV